MLKYKNTSLAVKTFYGVQFKPGEVNEVPGYINDPAMIRSIDMPKVSKAIKSESPKTTATSAEVTSKSSESKSSKETIKSTKLEQGGESDGTDNNK